MKFSTLALLGVSVCLPLMAGCFYAPRRAVVVDEPRPVVVEPRPVVVEDRGPVIVEDHRGPIIERR